MLMRKLLARQSIGQKLPEGPLSQLAFNMFGSEG
jgi:hypothetical protein